MAPSEATGHIPCAMQRSPSGPGRELRAPARRRGARVPPHRRGGRGGSRPRLGQRGVPRAQRLGAQRTGDGLRPARACGGTRPRSGGGLWGEPDLETILPGAHRCRATKRSESGSASAVLGSSPAGIICRATASIRRPGSQHRDPLLPRRHGTQHVLQHARAVRALRRELLVEHLGVDSLLDDRGALRLSREVAHANRARRAWGESLQGLAVAIDPAEYGT